MDGENACRECLQASTQRRLVNQSADELCVLAMRTPLIRILSFQKVVKE